MWPRFFEHFRSIKSIQIIRDHTEQTGLNFGVADLMYLTQLENLETLVLKGLEFDPLDEAGKHILQQMKMPKAEQPSQLLWKRFRNLTVKIFPVSTYLCFRMTRMGLVQ